MSSGTERAVFESASAAYRVIFESEKDELDELAELGDEIGDELETPDTNEPQYDTATQDTKSDGKKQEEEETTEDGVQEQNEDDIADNGPDPDVTPQNVNAQSQPASVSADALIDELLKLKYDEKIRVVAKEMAQANNGNIPDAEDMVKPVAQAISKHMTKKGYAGMQNDDFIKVVKTIIMHATDVKKPDSQDQ